MYPENYFLRSLPGLLIGLAMLFPGCGGESNQQAPSVTERQRETADPLAREYLVTAYEQYSRGSYRTALAYTDSAARISPELTDLHFLRGQIFTAVNQFDRAADEYHTVLDHDSTYRGVWLNLGNNAARRGRYREALGRYRRERALVSGPAVWVSTGRAYRNLQEIDSARYAFRRALQIDSTHAPAHIMLSELHDRDGRLDSALYHARHAFRLDPKDLNYQYKVGALLVRVGRAEEAIEPLRSVARRGAFHYGAHYNLGRALQQLGRVQEAQQYLAAADSLQRLQSRLQRLQRAARGNPENALAWARLGDALRRVDRLDKAMEAYSVALSLAPESIVLQNNVANLALMQGNYERALNRYRAILEQDSSNTDVWLNLGVVHARMDHIEAARKAWNRVLELEAGHSAARTYLSRYGNDP